MAVERHEALVPGYLSQVVLVGVPEIERAAERAATRRPANIGASTAVFMVYHISTYSHTIILAQWESCNEKGGNSLHSRPAEEIFIVRSKCSSVFKEFLRQVVAYVESVGLVVACACRIGTLAYKDLCREK